MGCTRIHGSPPAATSTFSFQAAPKQLRGSIQFVSHFGFCSCASTFFLQIPTNLDKLFFFQAFFPPKFPRIEGNRIWGLNSFLAQTISFILTQAQICSLQSKVKSHGASSSFQELCGVEMKEQPPSPALALGSSHCSAWSDTAGHQDGAWGLLVTGHVNDGDPSLEQR